MGHKRHLDLLLVIEPAVALEWLPRSLSDQLLLSGQAQQNNGRCQPQAKSGQVQPDPPLHAVNDVVIFCIHNFTPLYLIGREGQRRVSSSASPLHTCSDTKPQQRRFLKMCARVSGWLGGVLSSDILTYCSKKAVFCNRFNQVLSRRHQVEDSRADS